MDAEALLAPFPFFATLTPAARQELSALGQSLSLVSGQTLFNRDEPADCLYLLVAGRLQCCVEGQADEYLLPGAPVGAASVLAGQPYDSTVHATRDSLLLRFAAEPMLAFLQRYPQALLRLTQHLLSRRPAEARSRHGQGATLALLPVSSGVPTATLAEALVQRLGGWPKARMICAAHIDAALGPGHAQAEQPSAEGDRVEQLLRDLERSHHYLIYVADSHSDNWALRCLRHGDRLLLLAEAGARQVALPVVARLDYPLRAPVELVLLCAEGDASPHTQAWRQQLNARSHYYVQPWHGADLDALARQITGRGVGLVLGGGGARGFAHIGLIRALEQLQIPVDVMGGTSMGAFISALLACGLDAQEMVQVARDTFVTRNHLNDYTMPRVSLIRGRKFHQRLQDVFGQRQIEALRRSYFCVSSNLTTGQTVTHEYGDLATWVGTSMCVPGVAPPVVYKGELLCDGGVVDNLPTDIMQDMERGVIIASSVSAQNGINAEQVESLLPQPDALLRRRRGLNNPGFAEILLRTATLNSDTVIYPASVARSDVCLHMPVTDVNMFDWQALDQLIERGYRHALEVLTPLRDKLV